jgi:recombination protein RecT
MSDQITKQQLLVQNKSTVINLLDKMKPQLQRALPAHLDAERVCRIALTEFSKNPLLQECSPQSFIAAVMVASQLGLEIGILGSAFIVPFRNHKKGIVECNLIPGYRGLIDLARRSGQLVSISAEIVYANDHFEYEKGLNDKLVHRPVLNNRGAMIAAYAVAKLKDGGHQFLIMSREEIDEVKARAKIQSGPWTTDYEAMAQKTVVRRLFKWLPSSVEMQKAAILDEHSEIGIQDLKSALSEEIVVDYAPEVEDYPVAEVTPIKPQSQMIADLL